MCNGVKLKVTIDSVIKGYHIYKDFWESYTGEVLKCHYDAHNHHNPLAFWVTKAVALTRTANQFFSEHCN